MSLLLLRTETSLGTFGLCGGGDGLTHVLFPGQEPPADCVKGSSPFLEEAARQLNAYVEGKRKAFNLTLSPGGTPYMHRVWEALRRIPYGGTSTYGALARELGNPNAARAAGMACARNPIPIIVPCHRVVGSNGALTGFAGGLQLKERLLELERIHA